MRKLKAREVKSFSSYVLGPRINCRQSSFRPCTLSSDLAVGSWKAPWKRWHLKARQASDVGVGMAPWLKDMIPAKAQLALWLMWVVGDGVGETGLDQIVESLE